MAKRELSVNINLDEMISGLKAVQREAKEATRSLKELDNGLSQYSNKELADELTRRQNSVITVWLPEPSNVDGQPTNLEVPRRHDKPERFTFEGNDKHHVRLFKVQDE